MKVLLTGAHFTPAYATIEELKKYKEVEIIYVGRETTLEGDPTQSWESKILPTLGVKFIPITAGRLQRAFTLYTIPSLLKIPVGFLQALYIILFQRPDVILSFGGYVAVPIVIVGWLFSIPIIIHEQTLVLGLSNRISAVFADKIAISFTETKRFFNREKTTFTGNPIRGDILDIGTQGVKIAHIQAFGSEAAQVFDSEVSQTRGARRGVQILIMGGSQGSHVINLAVEGCLEKLTKAAKIIHVTGDNKFDDFGRFGRLGGLKGKYVVKKWLGEEYGSVLKSVDLLICRAGINTLMELAYLGKPALVIPIPYLYQDEQVKNAKYFENLGLVQTFPQSKLTAESLLKNIKRMINNLPNLKERTKNAKKIIIPDAAKRLALETILLGKKGI